jgi:hypothetical protein
MEFNGPLEVEISPFTDDFTINNGKLEKSENGLDSTLNRLH